MCSGNITRYSCGHEKRSYYYVCPDGRNEQYEELLPHRLVGRRFRSTRLCDNCENLRRRQESLEDDERQMHEVRAKALMEFFRGERPWPRPDEEVSVTFGNAYVAGGRLHPWLNRGHEPALEGYRTLFAQSFPETGAVLFQEMLDRQSRIDQTGIMLDQDRQYRFDTLIDRCATELRQRRQAIDVPRRNREHSLEGRESFFLVDREGSEAIRQAERVRLQLTAQPIEQIRELQDENQNIEDISQQGPATQQDAPQMEQPHGLYESDPDWLLNFDDWRAENSTVAVEYCEVDLRRDVNGWFQHLQTCESQARLDWIPFAETCRDAILEGDRCSYECVPMPDALDSEPLLSFRNWCLENADPAEIRISPMNLVFVNLLQGYADYLIDTNNIGALVAFRRDRSGRVRLMRDYLAAIPGAPLSRNRRDMPMMEDTPSNWQMCSDINRLSREGGLTTEIDIQQRQYQFTRLCSLRDEAFAVREGYLSRFRIERDEREARAQREREESYETDDTDDGIFMALAQQVHSIRGRALREQTAGRTYNNMRIAARGQRHRAEQRQDWNENDDDIILTTGIPAMIRSGTDQLQDATSTAQISSENRSGPAGRNYDEWQRASRTARAEGRLRREVESEDEDEAGDEVEQAGEGAEDEGEEEEEEEERRNPADRVILFLNFPRRVYPRPSARLLVNRNRRRSFP